MFKRLFSTTKNSKPVLEKTLSNLPNPAVQLEQIIASNPALAAVYENMKIQMLAAAKEINEKNIPPLKMENLEKDLDEAEKRHNNFSVYG